METLKQVLMRRDKLSSDEADAAIAEAKELVAAGEDPELVKVVDYLSANYKADSWYQHR